MSGAATRTHRSRTHQRAHIHHHQRHAHSGHDSDSQAASGCGCGFARRSSGGAWPFNWTARVLMLLLLLLLPAEVRRSSRPTKYEPASGTQRHCHRPPQDPMRHGHRRSAVTRVTGWGGIVSTHQNSLINEVNASEHLEFAAFSRGTLMKLALF